MKININIRTLRRIIREEVDRCVRWSAGFGPGGLGSASHKYDAQNPLPGLGDEEEEDYEKEETNREHVKTQIGARVQRGEI